MKKQGKNSKKSGIGFAVAGSALTIIFLAFINFTVGGNFPWFIFPAYAILWWPLILIFGRYSGYSGKILSLTGSLLTIALLAAVNYLTSRGYPWFLFPSLAILWWPIMVFRGDKHKKIFSIIASVAVVLIALILNLTFTPSEIWFHYPALLVIWWPLSFFFNGRRMKKIYSITASLFLMGFLTFENFLRSPEIPWVLFACYPVILWPVSVYLKQHMGKLNIALPFSTICIAYYAALNLFVFTGFPWAIYPAYAILWWPLAAAAPEKKKALFMSIAGTILTSALFIATNLVASPDAVWAVYPIFGLVWWPLSVYYFVYRLKRIEEEI